MAKEQIDDSGAQTPEPVGYAEEVRNDVAEAIKKLKGGDEPPAIEGAAPDEHPEPTEAEPAGDERARGPDGKFIPKDKTEKIEAAPEKVEAAPKELPPTDNQTKPSVQPAQAAIAAPVSWAADAKASWSTLPPAIQQAVIKREEEIANGGRQWSEEKKRYQATLAPLVEETQRLGVSPEQGLNALLNAHRMLQRDPASAIGRLAQQYGVDLTNLASNPPAEQPRFDPMVSQLTQHVSALESQLNGFLQNQTMGVVEKFAADHPHYAAVEEQIAGLIPLIQQSEPGLNPSDVLSKAYEQAIWLNPDVRAQLIKEQTEAAQKQQIETVQAKATQAKKAAVSVKGSSNGSAVTPKGPMPSGETVYDDVRAALNQLRMQ